MKKIIIIFSSLFIFFSLPVYAVTTCSYDNGKCSAGCEFDGNTNKCKLCEPGTFNGTIGGTCKTCTKPDNAEFLNGIDVTGMTQDTCPWVIHCAENQYYDNLTCKNCDPHYHSDAFDLYGINVNCSGDYQNTNNCKHYDKSYCEANIYTITIDPDLPEGDRWLINGQYGNGNIILEEKYGIGFRYTTLNETEFSPILIPLSLTPETYFWRIANGVYTEPDGAGELVYNSPFFDTTYFKSNASLYINWDNKNALYHIDYYKSDTDTDVYSSQICKTEISCKAIESEIYKAGYYFSHWQCKEGCEGIKNVGDEIIPISKDFLYEQTQKPIKLYAVFETCPAGYYCDGNKAPSKCPAGMTSTAGAKTEKECYFKPSNDGTKFCDNNGCFSLPRAEIIRY